MILGAFVLKLRVIQAGRIPVSHGRFLHAAFLDMVRQIDATLSEQLHNDQVKRFSIGVLSVKNRKQDKGHICLSDGDTATWRICSLSDIVTQVCLKITKGVTIRAGKVKFKVIQVAMDPNDHPASMVITTEELLQRARGLTECKNIEMNFLTPASFRYFDNDYACPRPDLIFRALAERWNRMETNPVFEIDKLREVAGLHIIPVSWKGETQRINITAESGITGFVGNFVFSMKTLPSAYREIFVALALFSMFSGVGRLTAQGMGVVSVTIR